MVEALRGTVHRMTMEARQRDAQHEAVKAKVQEQVALMTDQHAKVRARGGGGATRVWSWLIVAVCTLSACAVGGVGVGAWGRSQ